MEQTPPLVVLHEEDPAFDPWPPRAQVEAVETNAISRSVCTTSPSRN